MVAASAAALLAVSPLAFAGESGGDYGHEHHSSHHHSSNRTELTDVDTTQVNSVDQGSEGKGGLIGIGEVNALNNTNVCPNIPVGVGIGQLLGVLGGSGTATTTPSAAQASCTNDNSVDQGNASDTDVDN